MVGSYVFGASSCDFSYIHNGICFYEHSSNTDKWINAVWLSMDSIIFVLSTSGASATSLQWEIAIIGFLAVIIGAIIGSFFTYTGSYKLWKQQQKKELRTLANAFIIDLERIYNSNYEMYINYKENRDALVGMIDILEYIPFYDKNGAYFLFNNEIYKFDYTLSSELFRFYIKLLSAESQRQFIARYFKNGLFDYRKANPRDKLYLDASYDAMKSSIISTEEKILDLRNQLKKIRDE